MWFIHIFENFFNITPDNNILYPPLPGSQVLAYHACLIVGYNEIGFIVLNSHDMSFGDGGYFILSYEYINKGLLHDPWIISEMKYKRIAECAWLNSRFSFCIIPYIKPAVQRCTAGFHLT